MGNFSEFVQKNTAQTKVVLYKTEMQRHEEHKTERKWQVTTHTIDKTVQCHAFLSHLLSVKVVLCFFTRLCPGNTLIRDIFVVKNTSHFFFNFPSPIPEHTLKFFADMSVYWSVCYFFIVHVEYSQVYWSADFPEHTFGLAYTCDNFKRYWTERTETLEGILHQKNPTTVKGPP